MLGPSGERDVANQPWCFSHCVRGYGQLRLSRRAPIRVVVGEDQPLFRDGVVHVLTTAGMDVLAAAGNAGDLVRKALAHHPDVVIVDIHMPPDFSDDGLRAARKILAARPATAVLVLSQFLEDRYVIDLLDDRPEGKGYLLKDRITDSDSFVEAVRRVAHGGSVIDAEAVGRLVGQRRGRGHIGSLTSREREVLCLMAQGKSNQGIADELVVTISAVERHVTSIFGRMGLPREPQDHRRVLAVLQYLRADRSATGVAP
jgi:DNA-binding NarL/FixJ family response regulator